MLIPAEDNTNADLKIKRKIKLTRMRLNEQLSAEKVQQYFWSAMATDNGIDSYKKYQVEELLLLKVLEMNLKNYVATNNKKF